MQHLLKTATAFPAATFLISCAGNTESEKKVETKTDEHAHAGTEQTAPAASTKAVLKNDKLNAVYQHYIHLTTALTNADVAEAKLAANAIEAGAKEVDGASGIAADAAKITTAADIEAQRTAYETLSNQMTTLIKKEGLASGELYIAYCPMAFNDKGASWISNSREIRNPYFGEKMMTCGEIKDSIK